MALTDTFVKNTKPTGKPAGDKYRDGGGMYLLINTSGRYWVSVRPVPFLT